MVSSVGKVRPGIHIAEAIAAAAVGAVDIRGIDRRNYDLCDAIPGYDDVIERVGPCRVTRDKVTDATCFDAAVVIGDVVPFNAIGGASDMNAGAVATSTVVNTDVVAHDTLAEWLRSCLKGSGL